MKPPNRTRLVDISHLLTNVNSSLYIKMENEQITGSHKYRLVYGMLSNFLATNTLDSFTGFVEATSGNTGLALAELAQQINKKVVIFANQSLQPKTKHDLEKYSNVTIHYCSDADQAYLDAVDFHNLNPKYINLDQYNNPYGVSEFFTMGTEILEDVPNINTIVMGVGTGATITGLSESIFGGTTANIIYTIGCTIDDEWLTIPGWKNFRVSKPGSIIVNTNTKNLISQWQRFEIYDLVEQQKTISELVDFNFDLNLSTVGNILAAIQIGNKYNDRQIITVCTGKA